MDGDLSPSLDDLEASLNDFTPSVRKNALVKLVQILKAGAFPETPKRRLVNLHCHTFFSFNAYGYSPSGLAWLAKRMGFTALGMVDFDVLDGIDEFLEACEYLEVRGSAGIESRAFVPEFAQYEINSPGEPGITYHMGIGFTSSAVPSSVSHILDRLRKTAADRNRSMVERLNNHLAPVYVDYEQDVLPLTPNGNATERHILKVFLRKAEKTANCLVKFWSHKMNLPEDNVQELLLDPIAFQNAFRAKLMKLGGVGYVRPEPSTFPTIEEFHELITACGALPCAAWLDGTSPGERVFAELLELFISKGAVALNIIPDRNWNIADPEQRRVKIQKLYEVVELAQRLDLPLNIGTEMNSYGQKLVDDIDSPELQPIRQAFLDGAYFIYGHTAMQRYIGLGYQSDWAKRHLPERRERNSFYTQVGYRLAPGEVSRQRLQATVLPITPVNFLAGLQ
jgi:hypothetical protein